MTTTLYLLYHEFETKAGQEVSKLIGIYSSAARAEMATLRFRVKPGFRDHPNGFKVFHQELDKDYWEEGFFTPDEDESWRSDS
jgi:hypothetical protein